MEIRIANANDIELLMSIRLEMLREVNGLDVNYEYDDIIVEESRKYFLEGDQTTVLAIEEGRVIGCASMSYFTIMPTFSHPTGKRAHLMNVYTSSDYRRRGIAEKMVNMLIDDAWNRGATEISLDATTAGRPLYAKLGFKDSTECMTLVN